MEIVTAGGDECLPVRTKGCSHLLMAVATEQVFSRPLAKFQTLTLTLITPWKPATFRRC